MNRSKATRMRLTGENYWIQLITRRSGFTNPIDRQAKRSRFIRVFETGGTCKESNSPWTIGSLVSWHTASQIRFLRCCRCCRKAQDLIPAKALRHSPRSWRQRWTSSSAHAGHRRSGTPHLQLGCRRPVLQKVVRNPGTRIRRSAFLLLLLVICCQRLDAEQPEKLP